MKKIFKIVSIIILVFIAFIIILPIVFEGKIIELVKKTANNNINATLDFKEADLSIWSSFPSASVSLENVSIVNNTPFEGDTLFLAKAIDLKMPLSDLFKSSSEIGITSFVVDGAQISIKIDVNGNANYDIAKKNEGNDNEISEENGIQLDLESYQFTNSNLSYDDMSSNMKFELTDLSHSGSGDLSSLKSELKTRSSALISFQKDSVSYLKNNKLNLDAVLAMDFKENKYSFLENELMLNQLPLTFDGFVKVNETNQEVNITFKQHLRILRTFWL